MGIVNLYEDVNGLTPKQRSINVGATKKKLPSALPSPPLYNYSSFQRKALIKSVKNRKLVTSQYEIQRAKIAALTPKGLERLRGKLRAADQAPEFKRFEELPPELRARIYKMAMPKSYDPHPIPELHPLCQVSRLVRAETLPIYFARFPVAVYITATSRKWNRAVISAAYDTGVRDNIRRYEAWGWLKYMRKFYVKAYGNWHNFNTDNQNWFGSKFEIRFNGEMTKAKVKSGNTCGIPHYDINLVDQQLTSGVNTLVQELKTTQPSGQRCMTRAALDQYIMQVLINNC